MKKNTLTIKIWLSLFLISLLLYLIFLLTIPYIIRNFYASSLSEDLPAAKRFSEQERNADRAFPVRQFTILEDGTILPEQARQVLPPSLLPEILKNASIQKQTLQRYEYISEEAKNNYVIRKNEAYGHPLYQVSLLRKTDENIFVQKFLLQFTLFAGGALIVSWFTSLFIARYLTRPLIQMERHVKRIADRDWHEPLEVSHNDEFGKLANSIESMRRQLIRQEEVQQSIMQNISHELKTPVMVIRSHAQAMQDGIYPNGDISRSIQIIDDEGARLEVLIRQLLYLTRLDYMSTQKPVCSTIQLEGFIKEIVERIRYRRLEIDWEMNIQPVDIEGDEEKWRVLIENILDNHLRHALSCIHITITVDEQENKLLMDFWNDGSSIEPHVLEQIFQPFRKGREGKYGLGLTIAHRIVKMLKGEISVSNLNREINGVCTSIKIPLT